MSAAILGGLSPERCLSLLTLGTGWWLRGASIFFESRICSGAVGRIIQVWKLDGIKFVILWVISCTVVLLSLLDLADPDTSNPSDTFPASLSSYFYFRQPRSAATTRSGRPRYPPASGKMLIFFQFRVVALWKSQISRMNPSFRGEITIQHKYAFSRSGWCLYTLGSYTSV